MHALDRHLRLAAIFVCCAFTGCVGFHVDKAFVHSEGDWPMAGRTPSGAYAAEAQRIALPLVKDWDSDLSAGAAQNACIVVNDVLLCGTLRGELIGIDPATGKDLGTKKISSPIAGAPAMIGNEVYVCTEAGKETVFDYNLRDGEYVWKKNLGGISASPIAAPIASGRDAGAANGERLYVGTLDGTFYALRPTDGETLWKWKCAAPVEGSACAADSLVYCADTRGIVYALSAATGSLKWKRSLGGSVYAGLSAHGRTVYAGSRDHLLYALDALSGAVLWTYDCGERIMAAASVSDSLVVVPALNGSVTALSHDGAVRWKFTARSAVNAPCTIASGIVFAASLDTYIYALSASTGSVLWKQSIDARIKTAPIVWNGSLIVVGDDKTVYRFVSKR